MFRSFDIAKAALGIAVFLLSMQMGVPAAQADKCGKSHRVRMPSCTVASSSVNSAGYVSIQNNCSYRIVAKIDLRGCRDRRVSVHPNSSRSERVGSCRLHRITCCPRYGRCR